ncbi:hypothetical protein [Hymenobacter latericus]|uniref:hypothetical protein n=1 Tax=Hymenobacter sp. YIM 151858-1 TaxID=2987688 RepID=UPI0022263320|nr:hypothetical protein [Hymenobacter sp. YIM 151858-1]UYZ60137.1 hypothetical protein OIS50_04875 [Hymenobacter sp. YIM 151858-1]
MKINYNKLKFPATVALAIAAVVPTVEYEFTGGYGWPTYVSVVYFALGVVAIVAASVYNWWLDRQAQKRKEYEALSKARVRARSLFGQGYIDGKLLDLAVRQKKSVDVNAVLDGVLNGRAR